MPRPSPFAGSTRRIVVVGTTGSGKTTVASQLSRLYQLLHVEMDALRHDPGWAEAPDDVFRERLARALADERWVADGNYSVARDVVWPAGAGGSLAGLSLADDHAAANLADFETMFNRRGAVERQSRAVQDLILQP